MNHHTLRELAKIGVGLVIADILCALWLSGSGLLPLSILGIPWGQEAIVPGIIFDLGLILLLAHYGWNMKLPVRSPSERTLLIIAGVIFLVVCLAHIARLLFGVDVIFGDITIPVWLSWFGVIVPAYLSYSSFHFALKR